MDASLIKKKDILTHEHIRHDLRRYRPTVWPFVGIVIMQLCFLPLIRYVHDSFTLFLVLFLNAVLLFFTVLLGISYGLPYYHALRARAGDYTIETASYDGASYLSRVAEYRLHFSINRKGKRGFFLSDGEQYYTWSKLYPLSAQGVACTYAERDDVFYLVMHGNQIVMVYNTKLFELET